MLNFNGHAVKAASDETLERVESLTQQMMDEDRTARPEVKFARASLLADYMPAILVRLATSERLAVQFAHDAVRS